MPIEYVEYLFCREFGCLPMDLEDMPEATFQLYLEFMRAEAEAGRMREKRSSFYR